MYTANYSGIPPVWGVYAENSPWPVVSVCLFSQVEEQ